MMQTVPDRRQGRARSVLQGTKRKEGTRSRREGDRGTVRALHDRDLDTWLCGNEEQAESEQSLRQLEGEQESRGLAQLYKQNHEGLVPNRSSIFKTPLVTTPE